MKLKKHVLQIALLFCLLVAYALFSWPVVAQSDSSPERRIIFQPYGDQSYVSLNAFPQTEMQILLQENGVFSPLALDEKSIQIFEDDREIESIDVSSKSLSLHVTVVVEIASSRDLPESNDDTESWANVVWNTSTNDSFQLCFTFGMPACKSRSEERRFDAFFETLRKKIVSRPLNESSPLPEILEIAMTNAESLDQVPVIVLIRDSGVNPNSMPEIPEVFLERLQEKGGTFIVVDEIHKPPYQGQLIEYLRGKNGYYYSAISTPDDDSCEVVQNCLLERINGIRPMLHIIRYDSLLFQDDRSHKLMVKIDSGDNSGAIAATTSFSFSNVMTTSSVSAMTKWANSILAVLAPLWLMLVLILNTASRNSPVE